MTTHFYKIGSPLCVVCGHDRRTDIEGTLTSMEFCTPINKNPIDMGDHFNCGVCGCSWTTRLAAELCDHGVEIHKKKNNDKAEDYCGHERPARKVLCQLKHPHKGSHRAIIYWED